MSFTRPALYRFLILIFGIIYLALVGGIVVLFTWILWDKTRLGEILTIFMALALTVLIIMTDVIYYLTPLSKINNGNRIIHSRKSLLPAVLFIIFVIFLAVLRYMTWSSYYNVYLDVTSVIGILASPVFFIIVFLRVDRRVSHCHLCDDIFDYRLKECPSCQEALTKIGVRSNTVKRIIQDASEEEENLQSEVGRYKLQLRQWKAEGYDISALKGVGQMKDLDTIVREFKVFGAKVQRLKQAEAELASLNTEEFESEARSIQSKLKQPQYVDDVEYQLSTLKRKLKAKQVEHGATVAMSSATRGKQSKPDLGGDISRNYDVLELIGFGGFADVYKAKRKVDGRLVAIKIPRIAQLATVEPRAFLQEAELWSRLKHPNIVEIIEFGTKPYPWICMEYLEKGSLRQRIGKLNLDDALDIAIQICDSLYYSHHLGVIHRDIKPENVLFNEHDRPKLADWGLGKMMLELSMHSGYTGTPAYSSPEQVKPAEFGDVGWWTDIYQCGAIIYEMVTGQLPFKGQSPLELALSIASGEVSKPSEVVAGLPEELDKVVAQCLARNKEERYKDISMLKAALEEIKSSI